jgi:DHA1 family bicyclomycin/chloramphenicol resistance-like MFS transporter
VTSIFFIVALNGWINLYSTIGLTFLILCGVGITNPNTAALTLAPFSKNAGTAASLMGAMELGVGALSSYCISLFTVVSPYPMAVIMVCSSVVALGVLLIGRRQIVEVVEADALAIPVGH